MTMLETEEEQNKFKELYEGYRHFMWYIANQLLEDPQLAEAAVQEALLALLPYVERLEHTGHPGTKKFLLTVMKSKAMDTLWKSKNPPAFVEEETLEELLPEGGVLEQIIQKSSYDQLLGCILDLDETYRVIFEYKYVHQLSEKEIGKLLGLSPKAVSVRYYRARKKLQQMLEMEDRSDGK